MRVQLLFSIATAIVIGIALLALPVYALLDDDPSYSWDPLPRAPNDPPRADGQLAVCVQTIDVDSSFAETAKKAVEFTLQEIAAADRSWLEGSFPERAVHIGCPYPPALSSLFVGRRVDQPSYYHTFVFVLTADRIAEYLGAELEEDFFARPSTVIVAPEEVSCEGDTCVTETSGVYLTPEDLANRERYMYDMYWALGAGHLAKLPGPPEPYQAPVTPLQAPLPPNN